MPLLTFGHGTLDQEGIVGLLQGAGVERVVDVRRFPGSRRHPHVARDAMAEWLPAAGVEYRWEERLGGRRPTSPESPHRALRNDGFRGYADHMETPEFRTALAELLTADVGSGSGTTVAVMCSESVWWRCHRRLLADAVTLLHELPVTHLMHDGRHTPHAPTEGVRRDGDRLVYDAEPGGPATLPGI